MICFNQKRNNMIWIFTVAMMTLFISIKLYFEVKKSADEIERDLLPFRNLDVDAQQHLGELENFIRTLAILHSSIDKLHKKQKKDVTELKKKLNIQEKNLFSSLDLFEKRVERLGIEFLNSKKLLKNEMDEIVDVHKRAAKDMITKSHVGQDKVFIWIRDIARDFHILATKLSDGSIKEMKILSEKDYLRIRNIPKK